MKHNKAVYAISLLAILLVCNLAACAKREAGKPSAVPSTAVPITTATAAESPVPVPAVDSTIKQDMLAAYRAALTNLLHEHMLPDGTDCGFDELSDPAGNQFAVFDVDGDGQDELIVMYTTTYMAGQVQGIFGYDAGSGQVKTELTEYPLLTFFDNGVIKAGWSHNQGLAGSFWPYTLYRYQPDADCYNRVGMADAWEKAFAPSNWDGEAFPDAIDTSNAGIVYFIVEGAEYQAVPPVDASIYNAWYASYVGQASEVQIPFQALTDEHIAALS